ncbi:melibiose carrier protein, partial [uncultured Microcoleus sp.]
EQHFPGSTSRRQPRNKKTQFFNKISLRCRRPRPRNYCECFGIFPAVFLYQRCRFGCGHC